MGQEDDMQRRRAKQQQKDQAQPVKQNAAPAKISANLWDVKIDPTKAGGKK